MTSRKLTDLAAMHRHEPGRSSSRSQARLLAVAGLLLAPAAALAADAPKIDTGDTALILVSAGLVMLMTPGSSGRRTSSTR